jgi:hypothetical protein
LTDAASPPMYPPSRTIESLIESFVQVVQNFIWGLYTAIASGVTGPEITERDI